VIQPIRIEVDCVFQCPECKTETWHTIRELKRIKHLSCPCGTKTKIKPVVKVEVGYAGEAPQSHGPTGDTEGPALARDDFVASLVALGYRKAQAKLLVAQCADQYDGDDERFLTLLVQQGA
jgi:hypothetical protein